MVLYSKQCNLFTKRAFWSFTIKLYFYITLLLNQFCFGFQPNNQFIGCICTLSIQSSRKYFATVIAIYILYTNFPSSVIKQPFCRLESSWGDHLQIWFCTYPLITLSASLVYSVKWLRMEFLLYHLIWLLWP